MIVSDSPPAPGGPILGIDPGSVHTGYGLIQTSGHKFTVLTLGTVSPKTSLEFAQRLAYIHRSVLNLITTFQPSAMALEDVFTHKNPKSAFKLAHARAAAMLAAALSNVPVFEYSPTLIKNSITGTGRADKGQVAFMVSSVLGLSEPQPPDVTDALAVAICHAGQESMPLVTARMASGNRGTSWRRLSPEDLLALGYKIDPNS